MRAENIIPVGNWPKFRLELRFQWNFFAWDVSCFRESFIFQVQSELMVEKRNIFEQELDKEVKVYTTVSRVCRVLPT